MAKQVRQSREQMRLVDAEQVYALGPVAAAQALVAALQSGLDPAAGPARIRRRLRSRAAC
jgi:hypothetical protein